MDHPLPDLPTKMNRDEYYRWAERQPRGRFELVAGRVIAMPAERIAHVEAKSTVWLMLREAIAAAGVSCTAYADGVTVEVGDDTAYEPDALVDCGGRIDRNAMAAPSPVIVVEVLSPSTRSMDTGTKLAGYFRVPSIQHYLIVDIDRRTVTHHRRLDDDGIDTSTQAAGRLILEPPGIAIGIDVLFADQ